ncbi:MAG: nucleotide exchange factor GrpE [Lachnospiraceae bacterium]|nr:nucleotide exchange factor GrpE [Lachnospiraceae bacterium]
MEEEKKDINPEMQQDPENTAEETKQPEEAQEASSESAEEPEDDKASLKDKKKKKEKKDKRDERIAELEDKVKRQLAEFENFRNRSEKEKASMYEMGARSVIEKMLPVIDNFERGLAAIPEDEQDSALATGMQMIYKQLSGELEAIGVKPIEALGQEFDPNFHNAVMQTESDEYDSGVVAQELQKGYMYHDTVIRHSMVSVVQ